MNKELHIWLSENYKELVLETHLFKTLNSTLVALNNNYTEIHTTQIHFTDTKWLAKGYRIFVHMLDNEVVEIKLGLDNKNTTRDIRIGNNLEKLLLANEFGLAIEDIIK